MTLEDATTGPIQEGPIFIKPDLDLFYAETHANRVADERVATRARTLMFVAAAFMFGSIGYAFLKLGLAL